MGRSTEQEVFWETDFGDDYTDRNRIPESIASNISLFSKVFGRTGPVESLLELGSNIGLNLAAIRQLLPKSKLSAVEINQKAANELSANLPDVDLHRTSILEFEANDQWDFVYSKGVLIHINPDRLPDVYDLMYSASRKFIFLAEYYNPSPVELSYRGHDAKLFKRDFAGELMDRHTDLTLIDYGFVYRRDNLFPQDDLTWFLMEK